MKHQEYRIGDFIKYTDTIERKISIYQIKNQEMLNQAKEDDDIEFYMTKEEALLSILENIIDFEDFPEWKDRYGNFGGYYCPFCDAKNDGEENMEKFDHEFDCTYNISKEIHKTIKGERK